MPDPEKLHADALNGFARTLRADPAVAALVPDRVFTDAASAEGHLRCVVLTEGGRLGPPPGAQPLLVQRDVIVEVRAESRDVFETLMNAVVAAGMGAPGKGAHGTYNSANHQDNGVEVEDGGTVSRTDLFCLVVRQPAAVAPAPPPAPARRESPAPPAPGLPVAPMPRPKPTPKE